MLNPKFKIDDIVTLIDYSDPNSDATHIGKITSIKIIRKPSLFDTTKVPYCAYSVSGYNVVNLHESKLSKFNTCIIKEIIGDKC